MRHCASLPQFNVALIAFFNWYYTFLQLEPKDLAEQLKRQANPIPMPVSAACGLRTLTSGGLCACFLAAAGWVRASAC